MGAEESKHAVPAEGSKDFVGLLWVDLLSKDAAGAEGVEGAKGCKDTLGPDMYKDTEWAGGDEGAELRGLRMLWG